MKPRTIPQHEAARDEALEAGDHETAEFHASVIERIRQEQRHMQEEGLR